MVGCLNSWVVSHLALIISTLHHALGCEFEPWWQQTLFQTQAQHLHFLDDSIRFIWFDTIICRSYLSCEWWNRKLKINDFFQKKIYLSFENSNEPVTKSEAVKLFWHLVDPEDDVRLNIFDLDELFEEILVRQDFDVHQGLLVYRDNVLQLSPDDSGRLVAVRDRFRRCILLAPKLQNSFDRRTQNGQNFVKRRV